MTENCELKFVVNTFDEGQQYALIKINIPFFFPDDFTPFVKPHLALAMNCFPVKN